MEHTHTRYLIKRNVKFVLLQQLGALFLRFWGAREMAWLRIYTVFEEDLTLVSSPTFCKGCDALFWTQWAPAY